MTNVRNFRRSINRQLLQTVVAWFVCVGQRLRFVLTIFGPYKFVSNLKSLTTRVTKI